jgi:hypothetical protein
MTNPTRLLDDYRFPGFRPRSALAVHPTDPSARGIELVRRKKKASALVAGADVRSVALATNLSATWTARGQRFTCLSTTAVWPGGTAG